MDILLLAAELGIFLLGFVHIFRRDRLFGLYYFFMFVYAIFAQIGYLYFSDLSRYIRAYFGLDPWFKATWLILLSLAGFWLVFTFLRGLFLRMVPVTLVVRRQAHAIVAWPAMLAILGLVSYELFYLVVYHDMINWYNASDDGFLADHPGLKVFIFMFKFTVAISFSLYCLLREGRGVFPRLMVKVLFVGLVCLLAAAGYALGNRTDFVALAMGVFIYEIYQPSFTWKRFFFFVVSFGALYGFLKLVEATRYINGEVMALELSTNLLVKDYYAPAHMLFAAESFSYTNPLEVLVSNLANSLVMMKHPYLNSAVMDLFLPGVATRSSSYAFYALTEGFMVLGAFGFIYNALILVAGLCVWRRLAMSNSRSFNVFLLGLMGCMVINLVRGQSSYFVKYLYTFVLPGTFLYLALSGRKLFLVVGSAANSRLPLAGSEA